MEKRSKLNREKAVAIRLAFADGKSAQELAAEFGVSDSTIWNVVNYETWVTAGPEPVGAHNLGDTGRSRHFRKKD